MEPFRETSLKCTLSFDLNFIKKALIDIHPNAAAQTGIWCLCLYFWQNIPKLLDGHFV